jgi:hypothetical protein
VPRLLFGSAQAAHAEASARASHVTAGGRDARMPDVAVLSNRLTEALGIRHPIVSAPMAFAGGGALAALVTRGGRSRPDRRRVRQRAVAR